MRLSLILRQYFSRFTFTFFLILAEAATFLLFPLVIGFAINDILENSYRGIIELAVLGIVLQVLGAVRRLYDSRFYAKLNTDLGDQVVQSLQDRPISIQSARLSMINEIVEFLENDLPELVNSIIGLIGTLLILLTLNWSIFLASGAASFFVIVIYYFSSKRMTKYNKGSNDELEKQIVTLESKNRVRLKEHLSQLMRWNIKLSDLETLNFSITWVFLLALLLYSIVTGSKAGMQYGSLFALIMYVFQFIENVINLPFFYQKWIRLVEIKNRIEDL